MRYASATYSRPCPACHAQPGKPCRTKYGEPARYAHSQRSRPLERSAMPDLRSWWQAMSRYEGQFAKPRPTDLVVP